MKIKKFLSVPSGRVVRHEDHILDAPFRERLFEKIKVRVLPRPVHYDGEVQSCSDMPVILGRKNVFVFGKYRPQYTVTTVSKNCSQLSCVGTPKPTYFTSPKELPSVVRNVDALLVSAWAGERGRLAIAEARKRDIPIAMIEYIDHPALYGMDDVGIRKELFRGFREREDFDIFFKMDLPLGYESEIIKPLAPACVRQEMYAFPNVPKDNDIFYSGRVQKRTQEDRKEVVQLLESSFPASMIQGHKTPKTFLTASEYLRAMARSKFVLSPSGISWDSVRITEAGLSPRSALIAPKPYIETAGPKLKDGENAILYDTELRSDGRYHLKNGEDLVQKIRHYLLDDEERKKLSERWHEDVLSGHTVYYRSRYILKTIEQSF